MTLRPQSVAGCSCGSTLLVSALRAPGNRLGLALLEVLAYPAYMLQRYEVELDEQTVAWLSQHGESVATAAAKRLRADALTAAGDSMAAWYDQHPGYAETALVVMNEALASA
jgi:hypothetical protein